MKTCSECKKLLDIGLFHKNKCRVDGYHEYCKDCRRNQYLRRDQEKTIARSAKRYSTKKDECLAGIKIYYERLKDQKTAYGRDHYAKNKSKYLSNAVARKAHIKQATPLWFDKNHLFVVREAYALAKMREKATGIPWDVDHIIPLRGKNVCGLHVMQNIAVIPRVVNNFKRTKFVDGESTLFYAQKK